MTMLCPSCQEDVDTLRVVSRAEVVQTFTPPYDYDAVDSTIDIGNTIDVYCSECGYNFPDTDERMIAKSMSELHDWVDDFRAENDDDDPSSDAIWDAWREIHG